VHRTIVSAEELSEESSNPAWAIVDCRFLLSDPPAGRRAYEAAHIPGAVFADLEQDLSASRPVTDGGRHPLPEAREQIELFRRLGIGPATQVVAYDDAGGMIAGRLWWMLRYLGHEAVALLDGGIQRWTALGLPTRSGVETREPAHFRGAPRDELLITKDAVASAARLVDARDGERYRGEVEPIDPRAGHIPGARNYPHRSNLAPDGRLRPVPELRRIIDRALDGVPAGQAVFYCGSGVSSCLDLLALVHAGFGEAKLYVGSWSEWCRDPSLPIAAGEEGPPEST
jgi:thiosulfate/3-mercaptopyruvate sulfurtransferase